MALHILQPQRTLSQDVGASIGSGLAQGISALAQDKFKSMQSGKFAKSLEGIGIAPQVAQFLSQQSPDIQQDFISRLDFGDIGQGGMQPSQGQQVSSQPKSAGIGGVSLRPTKEQQKLMHEEQKLINKEVFPYFKEIQQKAKGAKENDLRLARMEKLIESGKLNNPQFANLLKTLKHGVWGVGLDLTGTLSPESQEFEKISGDFVKNAKDIFGNRITDTDLKSFLATIPNLSQSNEGKAAVIRNLKLMNKAAEVREKVARDLYKKYKGKLPLDFESEIEDIAKPDLDAIAAEFKLGETKPVQGTSSFLADLLNTPGKVLLK